MSNLLPDVDSKSFTISAFLIGFLLLDNLDPAEQNSVGNWFMMIGQVLCTNSAQQQVINNRNKNDDKEPIVNGNMPFDSLRRSVRTINEELQKYP